MDRQHGAPYCAHETLVAEARNYPQLWRTVAGLAVVAAIIIALNAVLFGVVASLGPPDWVLAFLNGSSPVAMLVLLTSFAFAILGVAVAARQFQHRGLGSVLGPRSLAIFQFWRVLRALLALGAVVLILPPYDMGMPLLPNLPLSTWVGLLPLSIVAILIQTGAEEILFRGYLQQSLAARFRSPLIWMGLPSILFALGHYTPVAAGDNAGLIAVWACMFGLFSADLTARSGTLGPAIAMHFVNNAVALLLVSLPDNLGGLALFHLPYDMTDTQALRPWLAVDFAVMIVSWLTARLALRR